MSRHTTSRLGMAGLLTIMAVALVFGVATTASVPVGDWDGKLDTGNGSLRVNRIDSFRGHFTRVSGPWKLIWSEGHTSRSATMQRERQIKRMKSAKWIRVHLLGAGPTAVNPDESRSWFSRFIGTTCGAIIS